MGTGLLLFLQVGPLKPPKHPVLDSIGRTALGYVDVQTVALGIMAILIILIFVGRPFSKRWAELEDILHTGVALLTAVSGTIVLLVFLFTDPPAFENLDGESRALPAAVTFAVGLIYCGRQIFKTFFKR
jgi:hypothetical protein